MKSGWQIAGMVAFGVGAIGLARMADTWRGVECRAESAAHEALAAEGSAPNLVLITVDTLRADHLGCYGHGRATSPALDRRAASGVVFEHAVSQSPWTLPSLGSIHTGLYPREHGATSVYRPLADTFTTLAEALSDHGYATAAVVSQDFAGSRYGMDQGFQIFDERLSTDEAGVTSDAITRLAVQWLKHAGCEPFFLWVHYFDPHFNYVRHPEYGFATPYMREGLPARVTRTRAEVLRDREVDYIRAVYDEEVRYTDDAVGELLRGIEGLGLDHSTVYCFTSDHGEYFYERGRYGHADDVYEPLVHVPLVFFGDLPDALRGRRVAETVEASRNITKTFLAAAGAESADTFGGWNLLEGLADPAEAAGVVISEGGSGVSTGPPPVAVIKGGWKLIHTPKHRWYELFRLPDESQNLWRRSDAGEALKRHVEAYRARTAGAAREITLKPDEAERLRGLGYLN